MKKPMVSILFNPFLIDFGRILTDLNGISIRLSATCLAPIAGCEETITLEELPEHMASHFKSYWHFEKLCARLLIHGFVPEKEPCGS